MDAIENFTTLLAGRGRGPDLDIAALAIAAGAEPGLDPAPSLHELDRLADGVDTLGALVHRLYVEEGFTGAIEDQYYDPRNSLLNEVIFRRRGIPITLAVVLIEVGRRAGISLEGVGMPGHFLVRPLGAQALIDPFDRGRFLTYAECEARFRAATRSGRDVRFGPHLLLTAPPRAILARILENLRSVYRSQSRPADLEWTLRMRLALPGSGISELVELGHAMGQQGNWLDAARFLESEAKNWPQQEEVFTLAARALRAHLN